MSKKHYNHSKMNEEVNVPEEMEKVETAAETEVKKEETKVEVPKKDMVSDEMGIIASGTKIVGDISTTGHLTCAGIVNGDIDARGDIFITGQINGKIRCRKLKADSGNLQTEINAKESVIIGKDAKLAGSICCQDITVEGTIDGDIQASGRVILTSCAVVKGNITASNFGVEQGAKLAGTVSIA